MGRLIDQLPSPRYNPDSLNRFNLFAHISLIARQLVFSLPLLHRFFFFCFCFFLEIDVGKVFPGILKTI